jgi:hypothetical protein
MAFSVNRIYSSLIQLPDSPRALPVLIGFAALLMGALFIVRLNADLNYDGEIYIAAAMKFAGGMYREGLAIYPMPVYPLLIALTHKLLPDWVLAGRLISFLSMTVMVIPLYLLTRDLFNSRAAFWSCIVFILLPETLAHSNSVLRDPSFFLLFTSAAYYAQRVLHSNQFKHLLLCALFGVLSTFFRVEGLILIPVFLCFLIGAAVFNAKESKRYIRIAFVWGGMGALLTAGLYIAVSSADAEGLNRYIDWIFYYRGFIDLSFLENYHRIAGQLQQISQSSAYMGIGQHVAETARVFLPLLYVLSMLQMLSTNILVFNLIPLTWGFFQADYNIRQLLILTLTAVLLSIAYLFFIRTEIMLKRYVLTPSILFCPWIGFGIDKVLKFVQRFTQSRLITTCIVLMLFLYPVTEFDKFFTKRDDLASRTGSWIARNMEYSNLKIVYNDQIVKFHADIESRNQGGATSLLHLDPTDKNFSKLFHFAKANKTDGIVVQGRGDGTGLHSVFPGYKEIKEFSQKKKFVKIFILEAQASF